MSILNLTQHDATLEQLEAGVVEPSDKTLVRELLTFTELPIGEEILQRAYDLATYAWMEGAKRAMIGGAPCLMCLLEAELIAYNIQPMYAFSKRQNIDEVQPDGSDIKRTVFKHLGFIEVSVIS